MDELAESVHDLHLVRLEMADEVPAKRLAVERMLALEVLRAVLADDLDARFGEDRHLVDRDVLRGRDDRHAFADLVADASVPLADLVGRRELHASGAAGPASIERSRRHELRLAPVELAVQLTPPDLGEHLPHPRRLGEPELREILATDLELDAPQPREVVAELGAILAGQREQRGIGRVCVGKRDDLRRVEPARLRGARR